MWKTRRCTRPAGGGGCRAATMLRRSGARRKRDASRESLASLRRQLELDPTNPRMRQANHVPRTLVASPRAASGPGFGDADEDEAKRGNDTSVAGPPGSKVFEVYGFVGWVVSSLAYLCFLLWALLPESFLHSLDIFYYPSKYWALALPAFAVVTLCCVVAGYVAINLIGTPPLDSFNTLVDEHTRSLPASSVRGKAAMATPAFGDLPITVVNQMLFESTANGTDPRPRPAGAPGHSGTTSTGPRVHHHLSLGGRTLKDGFPTSLSHASGLAALASAGAGRHTSGHSTGHLHDRDADGRGAGAGVGAGRMHGVSSATRLSRGGSRLRWSERSSERLSREEDDTFLWRR